MAHLNPLPRLLASVSARRLRTMILPFALALAAIGAPAATEPSLEQAVKASYIVKFAPFVEWPAKSFAAANSPFLICIAGQDPFGTVFDDAARYQKVAGHPVELRRIEYAAAPTGCHMLFLGRTATPDALAAISSQPILTISDRSTGGSGGIIEFLQQGGRVRFRIDERSARANGLTISSKLLGLAVAVDRR